MTDALEDLVMRQPPTADRPLLGTVVLVVEDLEDRALGNPCGLGQVAARRRRAALDQEREHGADDRLASLGGGERGRASGSTLG